MPINAKGGKKFKKGKGNSTSTKSRKLLFKNEYDCDMEEYALITNVLGNGRFKGYCSDNIERLLILRGKLRKGRNKKWVNRESVVLVSLREYQDEKADIIHIYTEYEIKKLHALDELGEISNKLGMNVGKDDIFSIEDNENEHKDITIDTI